MALSGRAGDTFECLGSWDLMRDFGEYLRAYWAHVLTSGWLKALGLLLAWVAGMFVPIGVRTFVQLPDWLAFTWMIGWAILGYVLAPYGMWKQQRAQIAKSGPQTRNSR
jgi:hypothetical protein